MRGNLLEEWVGCLCCSLFLFYQRVLKGDYWGELPYFLLEEHYIVGFLSNFGVYSNE